MYKYKIKEQGDEPLKKFQDERIMAFDSLEARLEDIQKLLRQGKIETIGQVRLVKNTTIISKETYT